MTQLNIIDEILTMERGMDFMMTLIYTIYFIWGWRRKPAFKVAYGMAMLTILADCIFILTLDILNLDTVPYYSNLHIISGMLCVPVFATVITTIILQGKKSAMTQIKIWMLCEIPFIMLFALYAIYDSVEILYLAEGYTLIFGMSMWTQGMMMIRRYKRQLAKAYADTEDRDIGWFHTMLWLLLIIMLLFQTLTFAFGQVGLIVYYVLSMALWSLMAYYIEKQKRVDANIMQATEPQAKEPAPTVVTKAAIEERNQRIAEGLKTEIEDTDAYLRPDISVKDVAMAVGTNTAYLSAYLNGVLNKNFATYINELRVRYACEMIAADTEKDIEVVAMKSGFKSASVFQRVFSSITHVTPSLYRQERQNETMLLQQKRTRVIEKRIKEADLRPTSITTKKEERDFATAVEQAFPDFIPNLHQLAPDITPREELLCMVILTGVTGDDVADTMGISHGSLNVARSRLRIRLNLKRTQSLEEIIKSLA